MILKRQMLTLKFAGIALLAPAAAFAGAAPAPAPLAGAGLMYLAASGAGIAGWAGVKILARYLDRKNSRD